MAASPLAAGLLATFLLTAGCATALKRESRCLASLTPDVLRAHRELARWTAPPPAHHSTTGIEDDPARYFLEARDRYQPILNWYNRVYERVRVRLEEEQVLQDVRRVLWPTPGIIFYPLIRWNVRSVLWDGTDPDAATDPVTQFCRERLETEDQTTDPPLMESS
jgi:hypothetical protein